MFLRKKTGRITRFVKRIRECYLWLKICIAEGVAKGVAQVHMKRAKADNTPGFSGYWLRFKTRMLARKFFMQAAICRYARRTGTYKNL